MVGHSNVEINFLHKTFANGSSANIKLSKTQLSKMVQFGGFLGRLLGSLLKTGWPLMKNVLKPLAKSVLISLGLTVAAATNSAIQKKVFGSDVTTLTILNAEMGDIKYRIQKCRNGRYMIWFIDKRC